MHCVYKKKRREVKLISYNCLPILMLLYIMLYIMLAYLMMLAGLTNAVYLYDAFFPFFLAIDFCKCLAFFGSSVLHIVVEPATDC